ncbi:MAG: SDR family oxidoreductase [Candidatus Aminicenantes bacterium]|nr:SDR family oxidoreductase [Candidatus Aminicenantes bacterium]
MNKELFDLKGKVAVITGGGGALGGAMAKALAESGAPVALLDVRESAAVNAARRIAAAGHRAIGVPGDVLDERSLADAAARVVGEFGRVDILVNAAGGNSPAATTSKETVESMDLLETAAKPKTFFDLDAAAFRSVFELNVLGTFLASRAFAREMAERGGGVIVNISSMSASRPLTRVPAYSAAKASVSNFTQWLATHLAPVHIRVNAIAPGFFLTDQNRFLLTDEKTGGLTARGAAIIAHTPMGRFGSGDDLAGTLIWLVSDASAFVTGAVLPVDGGFSAYSGV